MAQPDVSSAVTMGYTGTMDWYPTQALRDTARRITDIVAATYQVEAPERGHAVSLPAVDELVLTILSQSTTDVNSWRGYEALDARYPSWDAVADAPVEEIEALIRPCGLSRQKAPRIKAILQQIRTERGQLGLDFLTEMPPDEALAYLMAFPGVGRKTASCVLFFALGMPAMPVDTHVLRVSRRLALLPEKCDADTAHDLLEALLPEDLYGAFHLNIIAHGRRTCTARNPACAGCVLLELCPEGRCRCGIVACEVDTG